MSTRETSCPGSPSFRRPDRLRCRATARAWRQQTAGRHIPRSVWPASWHVSSGDDVAAIGPRCQAGRRSDGHDVLASGGVNRRLFFVLVLVSSSLFAGSSPFHAAAPIRYRLTFPEPQHRWMQVEASFTDLAPAPLELRMSRASPGRYSLHDFAKNVYDVRAFARDGREIETARPDPYGWNVGGHGGAVTVKYKIYGDRIDGTYLAIDTTHAHINMPAAIMWARGLDDRPAVLTFQQ